MKWAGSCCSGRLRRTSGVCADNWECAGPHNHPKGTTYYQSHCTHHAYRSHCYHTSHCSDSADNSRGTHAADRSCHTSHKQSYS